MTQKRKNFALHFLLGAMTCLLGLLPIGCNRSPSQKPETAPAVQAPLVRFDTLSSRIKEGESFNSIVHNLGLAQEESSLLLSGIKENYRFKLYAGQVYRVIFRNRDSIRAVGDSGAALPALRQVVSFALEDRYSDRKHVLSRGDSAFNATHPIMQYAIVDIPIRTDTVTVAGTLTSNLYDAFVSKGETPALIQQVTRIFAWDVDFFKDPREGDEFQLLVEKRYGEDGAFRGYGQVLSAKYVNRGHEFYGIYFEDAYYDHEGHSLEKMLLKVPLNFAHVSSGFTSHRLHPILGVNRPHWGIDYAAPSGTPIFAAGDGTIEYAKWVNGYGNTIKIRHNSVYNTYYAHLRGFASGMRAGRRVKQREVIAFLGMTGLATGPHLDYRVEFNHRFINPGSLKIEAKDGVARAEWKSFCDRRDMLLSRMYGPSPNRVAKAY